MSSSWRFDPEDLIACAHAGRGWDDTSVEGLSDLLALLYQTSLAAEEGHVVRLAAMLAPDADSIPLLARFPDRPVLSVQRLRKLGPAFDPSHSVLLVAPGPSPALVGIASRRAVASLAQVPQGAYIAEVRGVAELHLRHARGEAVYANSTYYRPDDPADLAPSLPQVLTERLTEKVMTRARTLGAEGGVLHPVPQAVVKRELARYLREIALDVRRLGCGGAFLLLPDEDMDLGDVVDSLHRLEGERGAEDVEELWASSMLDAIALRLLEVRVARSGHLGDPHLERIAEADADAAEEIRRTACLARIDGAVILDHAFEPLAVGAKLRTDTYDALPLEITRWLLEAEKGTRHKSVACAVAAAPGSLGLVVSADGEITLIAHRSQDGIRTVEVRA